MAHEQTQQKARQAEFIDDIDWFLNSSEEARGIRSIFSSFMASMERGSVSAGGMPSTDPYTDQQMGFAEDKEGNKIRIEGDVRRAARCMIVWTDIPITARNVLQPRVVLLAHYTYTRRTEYKQNDSSEELTHGRFPPNVEGLLGDLAGVASFLARRIGREPFFNDACQKGKHKRVDRYRRAAMKAIRLSHKPWREHPQSRRPAVKRFVAQQLDTGRERYEQAIAAIRTLLRGQRA